MFFIRFYVEIGLSDPMIPKDKNRMILSLLKSALSEHSEELFEDLYGKEKGAVPKDITFSLFMPQCLFHADEIEIPGKKMYLNISAYDKRLGMHFFSALMKRKKAPFEYQGKILRLREVKLSHEKEIKKNKALFRSIAPCVAREHNGCNEKNVYHSMNTKKGQEVYLNNIKRQALAFFGEEFTKDIEELRMHLVKNKEVFVKNYDGFVLGNLATFELTGKSFLLEYFYKAGAGSLKSCGFSMLDLIE